MMAAGADRTARRSVSARPHTHTPSFCVHSAEESSSERTINHGGQVSLAPGTCPLDPLSDWTLTYDKC